MRSIEELLKKAAEILRKSSNTETPILDAELILIHAMGMYGQEISRSKLITQSGMAVCEEIESLYNELINERSKGKPVQYITNKQEFMGHELYIPEGVLIPRPDTEIIVEKVIRLAEGLKDPVIIDMCTGSGAIAISLAENIPGARVWAADLSDIATECCRFNIERLGFKGIISAVKSDLFADIRDEGLLGNTDIVVSNPPYMESAVIKELGIGVRGYEPHLALDGGADGLMYYRRIIKDSAGFLKRNGILVFEVGYDQGDKVFSLMKENGYYDLNTEKDLAGYERCVWGRKTP